MDILASRKAVTGKAQTVLGRIAPDRLGPTLMHEHILIDLSSLLIANPPMEAGRLAKMWAPVSIEILGALKSGNPSVDNLRLLDLETAISELSYFKRAGGATVVDPTCIGMGRDPVALAKVSRATGLHVVMGCSYYLEATHPKYVNLQTEDQLVDAIVRDILIGVNGTGICAGLIGEVGCSWPLTANEKKVLRASGRAQLATGAPLVIHPGRSEDAPLAIIDVLREVGTDLARTVMCHIDRTIPSSNRAMLLRLVETGCVLEYDLFGLEHSFYWPNPDFDLPNDAQRLKDIAWLIAEGHVKQVTMSHDTAQKSALVRYGGYGYGHIVENLVPRMRRKGFREEDIQTILVETPRRLLTFV